MFKNYVGCGRSTPFLNVENIVLYMVVIKVNLHKPETPTNGEYTQMIGPVPPSWIFFT
jgi:hypothetical protein